MLGYSMPGSWNLLRTTKAAWKLLGAYALHFFPPYPLHAARTNKVILRRSRVVGLFSNEWETMVCIQTNLAYPLAQELKSPNHPLQRSFMSFDIWAIIVWLDIYSCPSHISSVLPLMAVSLAGTSKIQKCLKHSPIADQTSDHRW